MTDQTRTASWLLPWRETTWWRRRRGPLRSWSPLTRVLGWSSAVSRPLRSSANCWLMRPGWLWTGTRVSSPTAGVNIWRKIRNKIYFLCCFYICFEVPIISIWFINVADIHPRHCRGPSRPWPWPWTLPRSIISSSSTKRNEPETESPLRHQPPPSLTTKQCTVSVQNESAAGVL